jgi:hypothetical protein
MFSFLIKLPFMGPAYYGSSAISDLLRLSFRSSTAGSRNGIDARKYKHKPIARIT